MYHEKYTFLQLNYNPHPIIHFSNSRDFILSHSTCFVHNRGGPFRDKVGIHYVLSLSPLTCENSLALSHEGRALSEKLIIKVCDNLCHGWLSLQGTAVSFGPNPYQDKITGQYFDPVTRALQESYQRLQAQQSQCPP